ncbi:MAG: hypothetical protein U0414_41015 [Polyangiaceae bacterium]
MRSPLFVGLFGVFVAAVAGCGSASSEGAEAPSQPATSASSVTTTGPKRVALTRKVVDDNELTIDDVAELQLYLHGRIVLRREASASATEVTRQHTLRMLDGRAYDEVFVDTGTPGIVALSKATIGPITGEGAELHVNFDPDHPEEGFVFEPGSDGRFRMKTEIDRRGGSIDTRREARRHETAKYEGEEYTVVEGSYAYIEIDAEKLHALLMHQRRLPGVLLPEAAPDASGAPPAASTVVAPPSPSH